MIRLFKWTTNYKKEDEQKYVELFKQIKINEGFYFSYTYDLTHTLQSNILNKLKKNENGAENREAEESSDSEDEGLSFINKQS